MKWLFALVLAIIIFGAAAWFARYFVFKQDIEVRKEERGEVTPEPRADTTLPEFQAAAQLRQEGKLPEARNALTAFVQKYPVSAHVEEAKDLLGEVNIDVFLSRTPSPEKEEYIVKPGDVLQKIGHKLKTTPELIMRMNNLSGTMLHIGERLLISHPDFSIVIQRKPKLLVLLNHGGFFKQYHIREEKLAPKQSPKVTTKVSEVMAWKDQKRVGFGTKDYVSSTRWIRLSSPAYMIFSVADGAHPTLGSPPTPSGLGLAAGDVEELSSLVNNRTPVTITD
jgi:LysM repeat protein